MKHWWVPHSIFSKREKEPKELLAHKLLTKNCSEQYPLGHTSNFLSSSHHNSLITHNLKCCSKYPLTLLGYIPRPNLTSTGLSRSVFLVQKSQICTVRWHIFDTFTTSQVSKQQGALASQCPQPIFSLLGHALSELHLSRIRLTPIWYLLSCSQRSQAKNNNILQVFSMLCLFSSISTHRRNSVLKKKKKSQIFWTFNSSYVKDVRGKIRGFLWKKLPTTCSF